MRNQYALAFMAAAAALSYSFPTELGEAEPVPGVCSGILTKLDSGFAIAEDPEHICIFSGEERNKVFAICSEGHRCEVEGTLDDCKDSGECSKLTNVVSVRDMTLAQQQEQPPLPDAPPSSVSTDLADLPVEVRAQIDAVSRTCGSPVNGSDGFYRSLSDPGHRFISLHFEKAKCNNLKALCRERGCLHQVFMARDNQPYQLIVSTYLSELELKIIDGRVAAEVISIEGKRLLRWDFR